MKTNSFLKIFCQIVISLLFVYFQNPKASFAEDESNLKSSMQSAFEIFSQLSPYLVNNNAFEDENNHEKILSYLKTLSGSFHTAETVPSKYKTKPGFLPMLNALNSALDDALVSFTNNEKEWASWRLRTISGNCVNCHSSFGVDIRYKTEINTSPNISSYELAELYLISRQLDKAKEAFYKAALEAAKSHLPQQALEASRRLLVIYTRFVYNPNEALVRIKKIKSLIKISQYEAEIFSEWISAFESWEKETNPNEISFAKAKALAVGAFGAEPLLSQTGSVELLRASGIFHKLFMEQKLAGSEKSETLYYLGLIYARLPLFVINEMPQFYLELCIREFPGSDSAKKAFNLYRELTAYGYTGSSGMHLPEEVKTELQTLKDIAYGIKVLIQKFKKFVLIISLVVTLLTLLIVLSFDYLLKPGLRYGLKSIGFEASTIENFKLSLDGIGIDNLEIHPIIEADCCKAKISDLSFNTPLLKSLDKNQKKITFKTLDLELPATKTEEKDQNKALLPEKFPNIYLEFESFNLNGGALADYPMSFNGKIDSSPKQFSFDGEIITSQNFTLPSEILITKESQEISEAELKIKNASLTFNNFEFKGIDLTQELKIDNKIKSSTLGKLSIKEINGPIQLTNSKAEIEIDTDSKNILTLKNISANAFDGTLQVAKLPITDLAKSAFINLKFKNIDIKKLLELMNQEQVEATGSISGEIPINIQNGKISVKNGKLWAIEPGGTIKYLGDDAALGSNPQMMLAMQALKNLKFSTLTANVVYKPDGTLILNTSLAGKGLEMNSSRPINVNLNIEQNILKLFESLHAVDNFTKIKQK